MKKILSFLLIAALCAAISLNVFAADFNAGVEIAEADGMITVTVQPSDVLTSRQPTLKVPCTFSAAKVSYNGQVLESFIEAGYICFTVAAGGDYVITEVDAPVTPEDPEMPEEPEASQKPQRPVRPVGPEKDDPSEEESPPVALPFADLTEANWFYDDVAWVYENGLMNGLSATTFGAEAATSRGMIVTILWRLEGQPASAADCPFADVKAGSYYEQAIAWAAKNNIVTGVSTTAFYPDENITREQFAAILYRYAKNYKGYDVSVGEDTNILSYSDAFLISDYAFPALQWACGAGLMNGSGNALMPGGYATRAQAAALLHRFCENY